MLGLMRNEGQEISSHVSIFGHKSRLFLAGVIVIIVYISAGIGYMLGERTGKHLSSNNQQASSQVPPLPSLQPTLTATKLITPLTPTTTSTLASSRLLTKYLTGTYPSIWNYYALVPREYGNYPVCDTYAEVDHFVKRGGNDVYIAVCPITFLDPEKLLIAIAPNGTDSTARKYQPGTAVKSFRFGIEGLKGTWMHGAQGEYLPAYFEIYVKNNHMFLIEALAGYTNDIEDLLMNITLNF